MAEQRFGGDVRVFGQMLVERQGTDAASIVTRALLDAVETAARDRTNHTGTQLFESISDGATFVDDRIQAVVGAAPEALDTLQEIAAALTANDTADAVITNLVTDLRTDVEAIEADSAARAAALDALTGRVTTAETAATDLTARVTTTEGDVDAVETTLANLRVEIDAIAGEHPAQAAALDALTNRVSTAEGLITGLRTDVDAAATDADLAAARTALEAADTALDGRVTTAETDITGLRTDLTATTATANDAATAADLTAARTALEAADATLDGRVGTLETGTAGLRADVDALTGTAGTLATQADLDVVEGRVTAAETAATTLTGRVTAVEGLAGAAATDVDLDALTTRVTAAEAGLAVASAQVAAVRTSLVDTVNAINASFHVASVGGLAQLNVRHDLGTLDVSVEVVDLVDGQTVYPVVQRVSPDLISLDFGAFTPANDQMRVLVKALSILPAPAPLPGPGLAAPFLSAAPQSFAPGSVRLSITAADMVAVRAVPSDGGPTSETPPMATDFPIVVEGLSSTVTYTFFAVYPDGTAFELVAGFLAGGADAPAFAIRRADYANGGIRIEFAGSATPSDGSLRYRVDLGTVADPAAGLVQQFFATDEFGVVRDVISYTLAAGTDYVLSVRNPFTGETITVPVVRV